MCGRFLFSPDDDGERIISIIEESIPGVSGVEKYLKDRGDVYPSQVFPVIADINKPEVVDMVWGYPPASQKSKQLLINARSETADQKYTFKKDLINHRCIIPATGFYEWSKNKEKYLFTDSERLLFMGGLYTTRKYKDVDMDRFVILTKNPDRIVSRVHNRMPVLIPPDKLDDWLCDTNSVGSILSNYSVKLNDTVELYQKR